MSCGKVHTRRQAHAVRRVKVTARHSVPVKRRAVTPVKKKIVKAKKTTRVVVKVKKKAFSLAALRAWEKKHPFTCHVKTRTAAVVRKKTAQKKLAAPFRTAAVKPVKPQKPVKRLSVAVTEKIW